MSRAASIACAKAAGFRIEHGACVDRLDTGTCYWWVQERPYGGATEVLIEQGDHDTEEDAWGAAIVAHAEQLMEA